MNLEINVTTEALDAHKKISQKLGRYAIFKADEEKKNVILESEGGLEATFDEFKEALPNDEPR